MPTSNGSKALITNPTDGNEAIFEKLKQPTFDAVQYLNDNLPPLNLSSQTPSVPKANRAVVLQNASTETQNLLSHLSTHNIKNSSELTSLTDEILRSANRLAYEVEVLRGDANNLYELLTETLRSDIKLFIIDESNITDQNEEHKSLNDPRGGGDGVQSDIEPTLDNDPDFIRQLRMLGLIKSRLEAVINVFGEAMKWPVAPSEVSVASSLISVSAPELGVVSSVEDEKAREYTTRLRNQITELLESEGGGHAGLEAAIKKVNEMKRLVQVWKDTMEEKARIRVVESFSKMVEDRKKTLDTRSASVRLSSEGSSNRSSSIPGRAGRIVEDSTSTAAGLFRKLRGE